MSNRYLSTALRRALEKAVKDGRLVAEEGARDAIRRLGVADGKAPSYLNDPEKELRRRLRAHARALGDAFDRNEEKQETKRLVEAAAYAHWHRMLFARFLAERGLLRSSEHDVAITLEDCRELAEAEGLTDAWAVAERYAAAMLPAVFRIDDPVLALDLDPVHTQKLHRLVTGLRAEVFQAEDSLGWTYQFWRAAEKDAVNKSGVKIGADELPAVTQLFTEPYMVRFLLHNTLGAWWAGKVLAADPTLAETAANEDALRAACSLPEYHFDMLRFVREAENGPWRPTAGTFPGWPADAKAITMLDPCCGSGHFLTEALAILVALRQVEENLSPTNAVTAVLLDNLHGLEIDGRCVQIAAFAVALTAWRIGGWQVLPVPHIAWVGAPPPLPKSEFVLLANGDSDLRVGLAALHDLFAQAPTLGTLIDPRGGDLGDYWRLGNIEPLLEKLLFRARHADPEVVEGVVAARGMADAATILTRQYTLQVTNVPFLGRGKQVTALSDYANRFYSFAKADLATIMLARIGRLAASGGSIAAVTPQNWLFLSQYRDLRRFILPRQQIDFVALLGEHGFESSAAAGAFTALIAMTASAPKAKNFYSGFDVHDCKSPYIKMDALRTRVCAHLNQNEQLSHEDSVISLSPPSDGKPMRHYASALVGVSTADSPQYIRKFWEWKDKAGRWEYFQSTVESTCCFGGMTDSILWEGEAGKLARFAESVKHLNHNVQNWKRGKPNWGSRGVSISMMRDLEASIFTGERYDTNCCAIVPIDEADLPALWMYCSSDEFRRNVRKNNKNIKIEVGTILSSEFDIEKWRSVAAEQLNSRLPEAYSGDPIQWIFHGHPADADKGTVLHVALARLSGYRWPAESDPDMRLSEESRNWIVKASTLPLVDNDSLLGVPSVAGEKPLADRLRAYLAACFGPDWSDALERRLVAEADEILDKKIARDGSLEAWVRDRAFRQHCTLFSQRPFLWHISDGLKDGFSVFVHYHRFDRAALRKLAYTLLGDWLARAKAENNALRYEKGRELQQILEKVLEGEKPYDIFVRWKSLAEQPLGWDPDLDDGVRQNIRPFVMAGVLTHDLSKILKDKDRGNDVSAAPWYSVFNGERRNDHHTTLAEKRAAREAATVPVEIAK
ncbi:DNA methyltransferase [Sinorhizobium meliloti]|uniref:DNA methyltransferase n=1 Tax=Rhizobium meliloti TaxID=382 RepID=UPI0013E31DA2|nr:DNA methyltransferase [Sinorhizobium meliloti]